MMAAILPGLSYIFFSTLFACILWKKRISADRLFWFFSGIGILLSINIGLANFELYEMMPFQYLPENFSSDTRGCIAMMNSPAIAALIIFFTLFFLRKKFFQRYAKSFIVLWSLSISYIGHLALYFGIMFYLSYIVYG